MILTRMATAFLTRALPPETSHELALMALEHGFFPRLEQVDDPLLRTSALGLEFANPLGMAAGFDKDARAFQALLAFGFGHVEVGTLTPLAQPGNPRPRLFRLRPDGAIINRMGFNNAGQAAAHMRLRRYREAGGLGIIGVNIGANKTSLDRIGDYAHGARCFAHLADYLTINISSPNTPGLRALQEAAELGRLLDGVMEALDKAGRAPPVLVKIAPDLEEDGLAQIVEACVAGRAAGLIVSNTTTARPQELRSVFARQAGGLSGAPLFDPSTRLLARAHDLARGRLVLVGAGGVRSGADAWEKIRAGASLVQLYTGFIFEGPQIVPDILRHLAEKVRKEGFSGIDEAVGSGAREWLAAKPEGERTA